MRKMHKEVDGSVVLKDEGDLAVAQGMLECLQTLSLFEEIQKTPAYQDENWCECEDPETEWQHHPDGVSGLVDGDCCTCKTCNKLTQIG